MTGSVSIDVSLSNVWKSWFRFRRGKRRTKELDHFQYYLEQNLFCLWHDLNTGTYCHGEYRNFIVNDTKRRVISVASFRDRVVHRLLYDYMVSLYDKTFYYDVWSCRKDKGLISAIDRAQKFLRSFPNSFVWRCDITKFFDTVDHTVLIRILTQRVKDQTALMLLKNVIASHKYERERESFRRGCAYWQSYQSDIRQCVS